VAIKLLPHAAVDGGEDLTARLLGEARAAAALSNPAVVSVYDAGTDDGDPFIVMELVPGRSLERLLREDGALPVARACAIAAEVSGALAAAQVAGVVHRDIKPANVMVQPDGHVKVLDFGIARLQDASTLTVEGVLGTAAYMAPERARGERADSRADVYSLGCLLYAMLAGEPPFGTTDAPAILARHQTDAPPSLRARRPEVPAALDALVLRMLEKEPSRRPSAGEVRNALAAFTGALPATGRGGEVTERLPGVTERLSAAPTRRQPAVPVVAALAAAGREEAPEDGHRRRGWLLAALLAAVLLAGGVAALLATAGAGPSGRGAGAPATTRSDPRPTVSVTGTTPPPSSTLTTPTGPSGTGTSGTGTSGTGTSGTGTSGTGDTGNSGSSGVTGSAPPGAAVGTSGGPPGGGPPGGGPPGGGPKDHGPGAAGPKPGKAKDHGAKDGGD
jgi:serine/threonine-protein kinase